MALVSTIVFSLLVLALGLIALVLILPLRFQLNLTREEAVHFNAAVQPFGGLGPRLRLYGRKGKAARMGPRATPKKAGRALKKDPVRIGQAAIRLVSDIAQTVRFDDAALDLRFGLGDPAETGALYGQLMPLLYGTNGSRHIRINVEPVFDKVALTGRAALDLRLVPLHLLGPILRFGWSAFGPAR